MVQLQKISDKFTENKLRLVGLSYDSTKTLSTFSQAKKLTYTLVSDEGSKFIKSIDLEAKRGVPHPGTFIIGADGVVKGKLFKDDFKKRYTPEEILNYAIKVTSSDKAKAMSPKTPATAGSGARE